MRNLVFLPRFNLSRRLFRGSLLVAVPLFASVALVQSPAPATPARIVREAAKSDKPTVVTVTMGPTKYVPAIINVPAGKPVILRFVNKANLAHEALIGDEKAQEAHEKMMKSMTMADGSVMDMHEDQKGLVSVAAGKSADLAWTFPKAGVTYIGCHLPAHYKGGMKLKVIVKSSTGIA